jgi:hypothetical protein
MKMWRKYKTERERERKRTEGERPIKPHCNLRSRQLTPKLRFLTPEVKTRDVNEGHGDLEKL